MFYWSFTSLVHFWPPTISNPGFAYVSWRRRSDTSCATVALNKRNYFRQFFPFCIKTMSRHAGPISYSNNREVCFILESAATRAGLRIHFVQWPWFWHFWYKVIYVQSASSSVILLTLNLQSSSSYRVHTDGHNDTYWYSLMDDI